MAQLSYIQSKVTESAALTFAAASSGGDTVPADKNGIVLVRNDDTADVTVTIAVPGQKYGQDLPDVPRVVTAGTIEPLGPFPRDLADPTDNLVHLSYSGVTSLFVAAVRA